MSRSSRFGKLEGERADAEEPASGASLERFATEPEPGRRVEPADPMQPAHGSERLRRFEADGAEGLGLDREPLANLAMLECIGCGVACGKFETACHGCGASLTSPQARAHNEQRAGALRAEQDLDQAAARERLAAELHEHELHSQAMTAAAHGMARELGEKYSGTRKGNTAWQWWLAAAIFFALGAILPLPRLRLLAFALGTVCLLTRLPRSVWARLGEKAGRFR